MTVRSLRRTLLVAVSTGAALAALAAGSPTAFADRPVVYGPFADGSFIGPVSSGQSALHSPQGVEWLGRKFK